MCQLSLMCPSALLTDNVLRHTYQCSDSSARKVLLVVLFRDSVYLLLMLPAHSALRRKRKPLTCIAVLLYFFIGASASAQIPSASDVTSTPIANAGHDYIHAPSETVNPANGSLSIRVGVPLPPSRGFTIPFNFAYDSNGAYYLRSPCQGGCNGIVWGTTNAMFSQSAWSYSVPMLSVQSSQFTMQDVSPIDQLSNFICQVRSDFVMQDMSGSRYNLGLSYFNANPICSADQGGPDVAITSANIGPLLAQTTADWTARRSNSSGFVNPLTVTDGDGTTYSFGQGAAPPLAPGDCGLFCQGTTYPPGTITDRNGNSFSIATGPSNSLTYVDTIGRTVLSMPAFGTANDSISVSGFSRPYQVAWTTVNSTFSPHLAHLPFANNGTCDGPSAQPGIPAVSSITLPNGQQYTFTYDSISGQIKQLTYPTGGYVRYVWGSNPQSEYGQWPIYSAETEGTPDHPVIVNYQSGACSYYYDTPAIVHRYVSYDGITEVEQQDFTYSTSWSPPSSWGNGSAVGTWTQKQTTVVTHDLVRGTQFSTAYTYIPAYTDPQPNAEVPQQIPVESQIQYYDTNGKLLQTVAKQWANERMLTKQTTTLDNNQVSETDWTYNSNEMVVEKDDYDYGRGTHGVALRKTIFPSYHSFATHIVDKPDTVQLQDGGGNVTAGVGYIYDGFGNELSRSNWVNSSGSSTLTTSHTYDAFGNIHTTTDPNNETTTYNYTPDAFSDTCSFTSPSNAYVTSIVSPSVNTVPHIEQFTYSCALGKLASSIDENNKTTKYIYDTPPSGCTTPDGLARLSERDSPDGGKTTFCYNDIGQSPTGYDHPGTKFDRYVDCEHSYC